MGKRRHLPHTYEILNRTVDAANLSITIEAHHRQTPITLTLNDLPETPLRDQLFEVLQHFTQVGKSANGLSDKLRVMRGVAADLKARGITDFRDKAFTPNIAEPLSSDVASRSMLSAAVRLKSVGRAAEFTTVLRNPTRSDVDREAYTDDEMTAFIAAAERHLRRQERKWKAVLTSFGFDVSGRDWRYIPAERIIERAKARDDARDPEDRMQNRRWSALSRQKPSSEQVVDWILLNPDDITDAGRIARRRQFWQDALRPGVATTAAFGMLIMACDADGKNLSSWLGFGDDSVRRLGENFGTVAVGKARNQSKWHQGVNFESTFGSLGGLLSLAQALTRITRHTVAADTERRKAAQQLVNEALAKRFFIGPRQSRSAEYTLPDESSLRKGSKALFGEAVSWRRVRDWAVLQRSHDPDVTVSGQTPDTRDRTYLSHVLPKAMAREMATDALNDVVAGCEPTITGAISDCDNDLIVPSTTVRCSLGPVACFTCPAGRRGHEHIPALQIAIEVCQVIIAANGTDPALAEDCVTLTGLIEQQLAQFPPGAVENATVTDNERRHLSVAIHHLLTTERTLS